MPTLNKLEYLDETKQQIKNALNTNFNSQISDDDTFRSYVSKINVIYDNWPKVTGEDTSITLNNTKKGKMLLATAPSELTQETTPTPDNPSEVQVIKGNNSIKIENKNLINPSNFQPQKTVIGSGAGGDFSLESNANRGSIIVSAKPNTQYTVSVKNGFYLRRISEFASNNLTNCLVDYQLYNTGLVETKTFITNANTNYIAIAIQSNPETTMTQEKCEASELQSEKSSTATSYVAHQEQLLPLNLPNGIEYCKIGTYEDEFEHDGDKWYLNKYIGKIVLDGSENWDYNSTYNSFYIANDTAKGTIAPLCNYFRGITSGISSNDKVILFNSSTIYIHYNDMNGNTNNFKTWLLNNNLTVYYQLATPTHEEITDSTLINQLNAIENAVSYDEQTNISQTNAELPFVIGASALIKGGN